ncbi:MAG: hypothetical protein WBH51_01950 [Mycolicibacter algericus]
MIDFRDLPDEVLDHMAALRKEAAKFRHQRNGARKETGSLRLTVAHLRAENEALRAELAALRCNGVA